MDINRQGSSKGGKATRAGSPPAVSKRGPLPSAKPDEPRIDAPDDLPPSRSTPVKAEAMADDPIAERIAAEDAPGKRTSGPADTDIDGVDEALAASQSDLAKLQKARRARLIKAIALTVIAVVFIIFILQNDGPMELRLLAWTVSVQLIWVIVAAALLGALVGYLVGRPPKHLLLHGPSRRQKDTR